MNSFDKNGYIQRYNQRFDLFGHDIKTLGWGGDKARQYLRFKVAMELSNSITSVLDIGCGFGDMGGEFLKTHFPTVKYTGVDINPTLIEKGLQQYPDLDLRCIDILDEPLNDTYDLVCENGIFNYKLEHEPQLQYIEKMVSVMFSMAKYGISIDFMSTFVDYCHEGAFHMNEWDAIMLAKKLSKRFVLRNDYLDYEYCLYVLKD